MAIDEDKQMELWSGQIREYVDSGDNAALSEFLKKLDHVEVVDVFAALDLDERMAVFNCLDTTKAAFVIHEIDDFTRDEILESLSTKSIVEMLDVMPHDDAADVVHDLPEDLAPDVIALLEKEDKEDSDSIRKLLRYPEDTAGGRMTDRFISVNETQTVADALDIMRQSDVPHPIQIYVIDDSGRLKGLIPMNRLATAQRTKVLLEIMNTDFITVMVNDDQEDVANTVTSYDLFSVPVIDDGDTLVGIITVDDVLDVIKEEATEDMYRMAGTDHDEMIDGSALYAARVRLPWLLTTLLGGVLCAVIMRYFHTALGDHLILLALFVPAIMAMGGNIGIQSSTIIVRGIATERIVLQHMWPILLKQIRVGILMGLVCGIVVGTMAFFIGGDKRIGIIVAAAMFGAIVVAASIGTITPILFERFNIDPAIAAGPFVTISNDITGLIIYFGLALWFLEVA